MSRELKSLLKTLEADRDSIIAFIDEIDKQVVAGALTRELGDQILFREFNGDARAMLIAKNEQIRTTRSSLAVESPQSINLAAPVAIALVLAVAIVWNFGAITGFFGATQQTYYSIPIDQTVTQETTIPLTIADPVASIRANGAISGTGTASIYLEHDGTRLLIQHFDASRGTNALTGLVVDENATNDTAPPVSPTETVALTPSAQPDTTAQSSSTPVESQSVDLTQVCVETCALPDLTGPFTVVIMTTGDTTVRLDSIIYGTYVGGRENATPIELTPPSTENVSNTTQSNEVPPPITQDTPTTSPAETPNTTPPTPSPAVGGSTCTSDVDCTAGVCIDSEFQGTLQPRTCAPSREWCVVGSDSYAPGAQHDDSVCIAGVSSDARAGAVWVVTGGRGRFAIETAQDGTAAVIDKYGTMVIRGTATFSTTAGSDGWIVKDADNSSRLSIDTNGNLLANGALTTRTTPQRTAEGDFVVHTAQGGDVAVITQAGNVALSGDFLRSAAIP